MNLRTRLRANEHGTLGVAWTTQPKLVSPLTRWTCFFPFDREPHEWIGLGNVPVASVVVRLLAPHAESPAAVQASVTATSRIRRPDTRQSSPVPTEAASNQVVVRGHSGTLAQARALAS